MSSPVPYVSSAPFAEQKMSANSSSTFGSVNEAIQPKGCSQDGTWICWLSCPGRYKHIVQLWSKKDSGTQADLKGLRNN